MGIKSFKKIALEDPKTSQFQENVEQQFVQITSKQILDGVLLKNVSLLAGRPNLVKHRLGRPSFGWLIFRKRADSRIWDVQDVNVNTSTSIALACSHDVVVDVWVF